MYAVVNVCGVDDDAELAGIGNLLLEAVIKNNVYLLRRDPGRFPPLYQSGVRFRAEPWAMPGGLSGKPPLELFDPIPCILARGWGDCFQLSAWRIAELRACAGDPKAHGRFYVRTDGDRWDPMRRRWYHVEVRRGCSRCFPCNGEIEDPSRMLEF